MIYSVLLQTEYINNLNLVIFRLSVGDPHGSKREKVNT